jgi:predicted nucleotidyltransferase
MSAATDFDTIKASLKGDTTSVMLFGSYARNDARPNSDVDILQLLDKRSPPYKVGQLSVTVYDVSGLMALASRGSLFVLHLRCDGRILRDAKGHFAKILSAYKPPLSYEPFKRDLRLALNLLDVDKTLYGTRSKSFISLALYLLRTTLYIEFAEIGRPTFSVWAIAKNRRDEKLQRLFEAKYSEDAPYSEFLAIIQYLENHLGQRCRNAYGSVEALITNIERTNLFTASLGLRLMSGGGFGISYEVAEIGRNGW